MMKKITFTFGMFCLVIPIYFIVFWSPKEQSVTSFNIESNVNVDEEAKTVEKEAININQESIKKYLSINEIENKINEKDKDRYKQILLSLSIIDYERIKILAESDNNEEATKEYISILRKRLSTEKYNEIKEIISKEINIDNIILK